MLPKIRKINNPGRPVVSFVGCHSTNISNFADYHLQPIVKNIPSYVQDSNDFLNKINAAKAFQSSEGISAVKTANESYPEKSVATKIILF